MSFHWSCFIVPLCLDICLFTAILVCFLLFYSIYVQKKEKKKKKKKKRKEKKKKEKKYKYMLLCIY